jgi:hypothetical protein
VFSRGVTPILSLIVLLAWPFLGWGGRAEAGFALRRVATHSGRLPGSTGAEFVLFVDEQDACGVGLAGSTSSPGENAPLAPSDPSRPTGLLRSPFLLASGSETGGTSSTRSPSSGPQAGTGQGFILPVASRLSGTEQSGLLFLADERLDCPLIASRLFRPPRVV